MEGRGALGVVWLLTCSGGYGRMGYKAKEGPTSEHRRNSVMAEAICERLRPTVLPWLRPGDGRLCLWSGRDRNCEQP